MRAKRTSLSLVFETVLSKTVSFPLCAYRSLPVYRVVQIHKTKADNLQENLDGGNSALVIGFYRERKMRTKFFCTNFSNTPRAPGHPGKTPGTSQIPLFETRGRPTFEGGHELFDPHPFAWKTPTPPGGLQTQKVNLCALLFSSDR